MIARRESPVRRVYESGEVVWIARYTDQNGRRRIAKPRWNRGKGTFRRKRDAQRAIEEAYEIPDERRTLGHYFTTWTEHHPRSDRTNATNRHRISRVLDVELEGRVLRRWPMDELRRRHTVLLIDHLLRAQGRATTGAAAILRSLSAMTEDAITDEVTDLNPFKGMPIRANDPRAKKQSRPVRIFSFQQMHDFAAAAGPNEAMVRVFTDTGLRLGEVLPLRASDFDGSSLRVSRTAHEGRILAGTKTDHGAPAAGRTVPVPPGLAGMLLARSRACEDPGELLFKTKTGRLWREGGFYRYLWTPTQVASGIDIRPHECRHSFITLLRRAGVDDADLAQVAGHRVHTMLAHYTHPAGGSFPIIRALVG